MSSKNGGRKRRRWCNRVRKKKAYCKRCNKPCWYSIDKKCPPDHCNLLCKPRTPYVGAPTPVRNR